MKPITSFVMAKRNSNLRGKLWAAVGDSITEVNFRSTKNYHKYISEWVDCTVANYGLSGSGYYNRNTVDGDIADSPDLITVFLGTNDWGNVASNNKALGAFGDTGTTTVAGCIDALLSGLIATFPTKTIAVFTPLPRADNWGSNALNNTQGYTLEQLVNLIIQICQHYSIPCLDLYHHSGLFVWNTEVNATYFSCDASPNGDGLHPNHLGHEIISYQILDFLNGILGTNKPETPAKTILAGTVVYDDFDRAANTSSIGNAVTGQAWDALVKTGEPATWGVIDNTLYTTTALDSVAYVDSGLSDNISIEGKFATQIVGSTRLAWRISDYQNYFILQPGSGVIQFYRRSGGNFISLGTAPGTIANGDTVKVKLMGSTHEIYLNGTLINTITDGNNLSATKHGFGNGVNTSSRYDEFRIVLN